MTKFIIKQQSTILKRNTFFEENHRLQIPQWTLVELFCIIAY